MLNLIARPAYHKSRMFPAPGLEHLPKVFNSELTPDQRVARKLLSIPETTLGSWQRASRRSYSTEFARSLSSHRSAINAELEGRFNRADYFWSALYPDLILQLSDDKAWSSLVASITGDDASAEMADPECARNRLIGEVLIDAHIAFYNGQAEDESRNSRAAAHLDYIIALLDISGLSADEVWNLVAPAIYDRIRICCAAGHWTQAIRACELLLKYAPTESAPRNLLSELCETYSTADPAAVDVCISHLERVSEVYPPSVRVFQSLGRIYKAKANVLARGYLVPEALLAVQKALTNYPYLPDGNQTRGRLVEQMKKLQADANELRLKLSLEPDMRENAAGEWLLSAANRGFGPMQQFAKSEEATRLNHAFTAALAFALWREFGLSETLEDLGEQQLMLLKATTTLSRGSDNLSSTDVQTEWNRLTNRAPIFAGIDPLAAASALRRLESGEVEGPPEPPDFTPPTDPPLLRVAKRKWQVAAQPFRHWLLSANGLRIKAQVVVAIALLVYIGTVGLSDKRVLRARDQAFAGVLQAANSNQPRAVIELAEAFLSNPSPGGSDQRDPQVLNYYEHALAQLLLDANSEPNEELSSHLDRYRTLTSAVKRGGQ